MTPLIQTTLTAYFTLLLCYGVVLMADNVPEWGKILFLITLIACVPTAIAGTYLIIWT